MSDYGCRKRVDCAFIAIAASIIVGIVAAILQFTAIITLTTVFFIVAFGIAVLFLAILLSLTGAATRNARDCCCFNLKLLKTGILGTILTSVLLIAVGFAATSVLGAIFVGLLAAFFTLTLTSTACYVGCVTECD